MATSLLLVAACGGESAAEPAAPQPPPAAPAGGDEGSSNGVPAAGESAKVDEILERGTLRVGTLGEFPWLAENTSGEGEPFSGSSWTLAKAYAERLGVELELVPVSHETKVSILATGAVDVTIAPLGTSPEREAVIDFIIFSKSGFCYYGLADNPKLQGITSVDQLDDPELTMAYFVGSSAETIIPGRFPNLELRGVVSSGANSPVEEVLAGRADLTLLDAVAFGQTQNEHPEITDVPAGGCQLENVDPAVAYEVGHGIDKGDSVFLAFLTGIKDELQEQLAQEDTSMVSAG